MTRTSMLSFFTGAHDAKAQTPPAGASTLTAVVEKLAPGATRKSYQELAGGRNEHGEHTFEAFQ